jgi:hypothetical protein
MRLYGVCAAFAALGLSVLAQGCSATVTTSVTPLEPPSGCTPDSSVNCREGDGWSCDNGDNPEVEASGLSCSIGVTDTATGGLDYCCFSWTYGDSSCTPDDTIACPTEGSYGYDCGNNDDPTSLDSSLNCSEGVADNIGGFEYCCQ